MINKKNRYGFNAFEFLFNLLGIDKSESKTIKSNDLFNVLNLFNYSEMVDFVDSLAYEQVRQKIIHIPGSSVWLMRRMESQISNNYDAHKSTEKIVFDLADKNREWTSSHLTSHLFGHFKFQDINKVLNTKNLFLVFKNVDQMEREYLDKVLIKDLWQSLCSRMAASKGFLLMLWIDQGNVNDWQGNPNNISESIYPLAKGSSFSRQDFEIFLPVLAKNLQLSHLKDPCHRAQECDRLWQESEQGQIEATLKAFYKTFQCNLASETRWLNYP
jgi:hypothetical protein